MLGSHGGVDEDSKLLGGDAVSLFVLCCFVTGDLSACMGGC